MIVKPGKPTSLDRRLQTLADPELAERLRAAHPELFLAPASTDPAPPQTRSAPETGATPAGVWRTFAIIGMLLAVVSAVVSGWASRQHTSNNVTPLVSLSSMVAPPVIKHRIWTHGNLGPAAAQRIVKAQQLWLRQHPVAATVRNAAPLGTAPRVRIAQSTQHQLQTKGHAPVRTRPYESTTTRQAPAVETSAAANTSSANATQAATASASENDPTDADITSGRQIPNGPVWTENGPPVIFGGGGSGGDGPPVILGGGGSGGGGLPSCTPRRFGSSGQYGF